MDFPFVKEALTQLFSKPSTIAFPAEPSPAKPNYRGKIIFYPEKCINCNMCERVCAGQAISHSSEPCEEGEKITRQFYLGSCTFCAHCANFCTHGAIELSDNYHMIATKEEDLIVSGTFIKTAPVKKAAAAAATAAAKAAPVAEAKAAEVKKAAETVKEEAVKAATEVKAEVAKAATEKAEQAAEGTEAPAPKPKRTRMPKTETADAAATAAGAEVTEKAAKAETPKKKAAPKAAEETPAEAAPSAEGKPAPAEETPAVKAPAEITAAPEPRDDGKPVQDPSKCIYCTLCARNCPAGALTVDRKEKTWVLDEDLCVACGTCQGVCPKDAIIM